MNYKLLSNNELCLLYKDTDNQLVFNTLYHRLKTLIHKRIYNLVKHDKDAVEDIEQIVWRDAARAIKDNFKFDSDFNTYLYRIVTTRYMNYFRSYKSSFMSESEVAMIIDFLYSTGIGSDERKGNKYEELHKGLTNIVECGNNSSNDDTLEAIVNITNEVLLECSHDEQICYLYRVDKYKGMSEAARELGLSYATVKRIAKGVEAVINDKVNNYIERYCC